MKKNKSYKICMKTASKIIIKFWIVIFHQNKIRIRIKWKKNYIK